MNRTVLAALMDPNAVDIFKTAALLCRDMLKDEKLRRTIELY